MLDLDDIVDWHGRRGRVVGIFTQPAATIQLHDGETITVGQGVLRKVEPTREEQLEASIRRMNITLNDFGSTPDEFARKLAELFTRIERADDD